MNFIESLLKSHKNRLQSETAVKIIKNTGWLVGDRVFNMAIGVFVTALVARYFGPENFGKFNYALSLVALFTALSTLGLETLTVKAIVGKEQEEGVILCTSLVLRLIGGGILTVMAVLIIRILEPGDSNIHLLVLILSFMLVFRALEVIEYWIHAYQRGKIYSLVSMSSYVAAAALKIALVLMGGSLIHYGLIYMFHAMILGAGLVVVYFKFREKKFRWKVDKGYAKAVLSKSWYLILSGLMVTLYMQIDKVMLGSLMPTKEEVGIYSAAVQVAGMWYFVPLAIITSFQPVIMRKKDKDEEGYLKTIQLLYTIITWLGIGFSVFILIFSAPIVNLLYGADYQKASGILSISIWAGTFAMLGSARGAWLISEGLQRFSLIYISAGATINVVLNYLLIPILGGYGAAIATLVSQITVAVIAPLFIKETRISSIMMLRAFRAEGIIRNR